MFIGELSTETNGIGTVVVRYGVATKIATVKNDELYVRSV